MRLGLKKNVLLKIYCKNPYWLIVVNSVYTQQLDYSLKGHKYPDEIKDVMTWCAQKDSNPFFLKSLSILEGWTFRFSKSAKTESLETERADDTQIYLPIPQFTPSVS